MHAQTSPSQVEHIAARGPNLADVGIALLVLIFLSLGGFLVWRYGSMPLGDNNFVVPQVVDARAVEIIRQAQTQASITPRYPDVYSFHKVRRSFDGKAQVWRSSEVQRLKFEHLFAQTVPQELWPKLERWLAHALKLAERYQIDPIWVLSVMWTESHFHSEAESPKSAFGLMQIMPETAGHLALHMGHLLKRNLDFRRPKDNLEMGIFYLRWLHERFGGNYTYATVAYNMGPYWVQKRLKEGGPVGVSNNYLNKVRAYYDHLSSRYTHLIAQRKLPYLDSLVFIDHKRDSYLAHYWNGLRPWLTDKNAWGQLVVAFNQFPAQSHGQL